jgi:adenylate cyclase
MEAVYNRFSDVPDATKYLAFGIYLYGAHRYEILLSQDPGTAFGPSLFTDCFGGTPEGNPELYEAQRDVFEDVRTNMAALALLSEEPAISVSEMAERLNISEQDAEDRHAILGQLLNTGGPAPADRPLYFRPPVTIGGQHLSFDDLEGGVFFYGLTASGTHDLNPMPFSPRYPMVGALANVFNTIVTNQFITQMSLHWRFPLFLIIGFCAGFILSSSTAFRGSLFTVLFLVAYILFAYELFATRGVWIDVVGPIGIVILSDAAIVWHKFSTAEKKRKFIKSAFGYYMNPAVVEEIAKNPEMLELGGKKMELTAFFSDVASFTTISEKLTEHELVELLNEYLTEMTEIVLKHYGNLDKYEGDAIMAFFGAPIHFPDHATRACHTALEMQDKLIRLREQWKSQGRPELTARVGINTGPMIVGNMGSQNRFDYTVMGDAVNLASRLEGVNKQYSTEIMISEFTLEHCKSDIVTREIDLIRVKGKALPVRIYEVIGRTDDTIPETMQSVIEHFALGMEAYKQKRWEDGIREFQACLDIKPDDGPSLTYIKRCNEYLESAPPDDWDGVYIMTTK